MLDAPAEALSPDHCHRRRRSDCHLVTACTVPGLSLSESKQAAAARTYTAEYLVYLLLFRYLTLQQHSRHFHLADPCLPDQNRILTPKNRAH